MAGIVPLEAVLLVVLLGPEVLGAILYLSLRLRTRDSAQRYRIALVGGGILLWFALDLFLPATTIPWLIARTILLVIPGTMSLVAFYPPASGSPEVRGHQLRPATRRAARAGGALMMRARAGAWARTSGFRGPP